MRALSASVALAGLLLAVPPSPAMPIRKPSPAPRAVTPTPAPLSPALKSQAHKTLAAAVAQRQGLRSRLPAPRNSVPGFQAHRCVVIYDETVSERERKANGPFRTTCSDWVSRATKALAVRDGQQPCTASQLGPGLVGCLSWVDSWDKRAGKWDEVWRQSVP